MLYNLKPATNPHHPQSSLEIELVGLDAPKRLPDGTCDNNGIGAVGGVRPWVQILPLPQGNFRHLAESPMSSGLS